MKEPRLFKPQVASIQVNSNPVVRLGRSSGKLRVIAVGDQQVHQSVLVEIRQLKSGMAPARRLLKNEVLGEMSLAVAGEKEHRLFGLRQQHGQILMAVVIEVMNRATERAGFGDQNVLLIFLLANIFEPRKTADEVAVNAQREIRTAVFIEIAELDIGCARQIAQNLLAV